LTSLAPPRQSKPDRPTTSVLVWNVHKGRAARFDAAFTRLVSAADLVLVQEATDRMLEHRSLQGHHRTLGTSFVVRRSDLATGPMTASLDRPLSSEVIRSPDREPLTRTPKLVLITRHAIAEDSLLVANVHALNFVTEARFGRMMDMLEAELQAHDGPVLLAGDFNTRTRRRMRVVAELGDRLGLEPVRFDDDGRSRFAGFVVDHAFVRGAEILDARTFRSRTTSDHAALIFELRLR
jgi:endonuclease/exonuclease/phosphatase (EEP) superfamily protein YafD